MTRPSPPAPPEARLLANVELMTVAVASTSIARARPSASPPAAAGPLSDAAGASLDELLTKLEDMTSSEPAPQSNRAPPML